MTILIFGKDGQLGSAFQKHLRDDKNIIFLGRNECDISNEKSLTKYLSLYKPEVLINAAAFTAVDLAESSEEIAYAVNSKAPQFMAQYCVEHGGNLFISQLTMFLMGLKKSNTLNPIHATL